MRTLALLVSLTMALAAFAAGQPAPPAVPTLAVESDGSDSAARLALTVESALAGLGIELVPDASRADWVLRLSSTRVGIELAAGGASGIEWARGFSAELERNAPRLRSAARAATCRACGSANTLSLGLDDSATPEEQLATAISLRESFRAAAGLSDRLAGTPASIVTPAPGSTLTSTSATFTWDTGTGVARYYLFVGNWLGGNTLYSADAGTAQSASVSGLPNDGRKVYVRLWSLIDGAWTSRDFEFRSFSTTPGSTQKATITSPTPGSVLAGASATFNWSAGNGVTRYWLFAGLWEGSNGIHSSDQGDNRSATISGLPTDGRNIFVRLWSYIDGSWQASDASYRASGAPGPAQKAVITSPTPGSALPGSTATFTWSAGTGVSRYHLMAGLWRGGATLYNQDTNGALSAAISGLPTDGRRVYVRLFSYIDSAWQFNDYEFDGFDPSPGPAQKATLSSPAPGSTLGATAATFTWTAGKKAEGYFLMIGDWTGDNGRYSQFFASGTTSASVSGLPSDGRLLFVRLWSHTGGQWEFNDYQVRAFKP